MVPTLDALVGVLDIMKCGRVGQYTFFKVSTLDVARFIGNDVVLLPDYTAQQE